MLTAISLWIVWEGMKLDLPREKIVRMLGNVAIEAALGSVPPVVGDLFDASIWKANLRNLAIIDQHLEHRKRGTDDVGDNIWPVTAAR